MNIGSQGTLEYQRSTFTDLYNGPGSRPYDPVTNRFNLTYAQNLGVNWLWFQPIHPIGVDGRQTDPDTGQPYVVGSPYSVKNFFQVNPLLSKANTRDAALMEFTNFVAAADGAGINVMLDAPFNHTAWDCELDASGVYYFATNAAPDRPDPQPRSPLLFPHRRLLTCAPPSAGSVAVAPDRYDFGKWPDVRRRLLRPLRRAGCQNPLDNGQLRRTKATGSTTPSARRRSAPATAISTASRATSGAISADYMLYWLDKTGCPAGTPPNQTCKGIDGLRADFGQGLPPQCWEYIINKVRSRKWDFVFMS